MQCDEGQTERTFFNSCITYISWDVKIKLFTLASRQILNEDSKSIVLEKEAHIPDPNKLLRFCIPSKLKLEAKPRNVNPKLKVGGGRKNWI